MAGCGLTEDRYHPRWGSRGLERLSWAATASREPYYHLHLGRVTLGFLLILPAEACVIEKEGAPEELGNFGIQGHRTAKLQAVEKCGTNRTGEIGATLLTLAGPNNRPSWPKSGER